MQHVFVLDSQKQSLMPCHPARARKLLASQKASIFRRYPFTIILKERIGGNLQPLQIKLDPGSQTTGIALVVEGGKKKRVVWGAELTHRGQQIRNSLVARQQLRSTRRNRKTRYRPSRVLNRRFPKGWLPPSLLSRIANIETWVKRLYQSTPITSLSIELVKFDTQLMQNAEISGIEYRQGELYGYEVRQYLIEKFERKCAYCGKGDISLEVDHIVPTTRGGSERISNLALACYVCNKLKGDQTAAEFGFPSVQKRAKMPLKDAAAMNATRYILYKRLMMLGLPIETGTGGQTRFNRTKQGYGKSHWIDAACLGESGIQVSISPKLRPLLIRAMGHGRRQRCRPDASGFPRGHAPKAKFYLGFQTGDIVRAVLPVGKHVGTHIGRIAIRHRPMFRLKGLDVHPKYITRIHGADGYEYQLGDSVSRI